MTVIRKGIEKFKAMSLVQRIEFSAAMVLSLALVIGLPVYAWLANNKSLETMTKIMEPGEIIIRSGNEESVEYFALQDIDIESIASGTPQKFVFSVKPGGYNNNVKYGLQIAHTTNIPFTYSIYKAAEDDTDLTGMTEDQIEDWVGNNDLAIYNKKNNKSDPMYYKKVGDALDMVTLNPDSTYGRILGDKTNWTYGQTYDGDGDDPELYAVPVYLQTRDDLFHPETAPGDYDFYILELGWDRTAATAAGAGLADWNKAENNKETDMIYITASKRLS